MQAGPGDADLAAEFASIARTLLSGTGVADTLARIAQVSVATVEACDGAGIFLREDQETRTATATDDLVLRVDQLQRSSGEGPCLDCVRGSAALVVADDLGNDPRYPEFGPRAAAEGIRSVLALRLLTDAPQGALNLYAALPDAFGALDRGRALILASHATIALDTAGHRAEEIARSDKNLRDALASRGIIGQAQGILMERERISADQAFDVLRKASQDLNVKLRDVAQRLVDTGEYPGGS